MSRDGKTCSYKCPDVTQDNPDNPLNCGQAHKKIYGITGYDTPNHWCSIADATL
jgi:hypothetical protein